MRIYTGISISLFDWKFKNLFNKVKQISKNKFIEFEVLKTDQIFNFTFSLTTKTDHAGLTIDVGVLGIELSFNFYDCRHWDDDNNCWEKYEDYRI